MNHQKKNIIELTRCSLKEYKAIKKLPVAVLLDNVRSMHNVGAVFRTSDAFLIDHIILGGISGIPPHPEIRKTALGAEDSVSWYHIEDSFKEALKMKEEGWKLCVLEQAHDSLPLQEFRSSAGEKYLLIAGNEVEGVDQRIVDIADIILEIPQHGVKHSLNVSVSVGIALWQMIKDFRL